MKHRNSCQSLWNDDKLNGQNTDIIRSWKGNYYFYHFFLLFYINKKIKLSWENSSDDPIFFWLQITNNIFLHKILRFNTIPKVTFFCLLTCCWTFFYNIFYIYFAYFKNQILYQCTIFLKNAIVFTCPNPSAAINYF